MTAVSRLTQSTSVRDEVTTEEWDRRVALAVIYRAMDLFGMTDFIYNHITARVPGEPGNLLINPYGLLYKEVTASNLCKIDLEGRILSQPDPRYGVNGAGYVIHSAVHSVRHDMECVIHTHTKNGLAVSMMECGLLPISQQALGFDGRLSYHDYEGPAFDTGERERLAANLGENNAMILRNHGLLVGGPSLIDAFLNIYLLESACAAQVAAMAGGGTLNQVAEDAKQRTHQVVANMRGGGSLLEWDALVRMVEAADPSYKD